ncbi:MAG: hypothetical protein AAGI91_12900 [Bacteroidota bacterium]
MYEIPSSPNTLRRLAAFASEKRLIVAAVVVEVAVDEAGEQTCRAVLITTTDDSKPSLRAVEAVPLSPAPALVEFVRDQLASLPERRPGFSRVCLFDADWITAHKAWRLHRKPLAEAVSAVVPVRSTSGRPVAA